MRPHDAAAARRRVHPGHEAVHRRRAGDLRDARRGRPAHAGRLLHVRREAGGSHGMVLTAVGRVARRETGRGHRAGRPGGREPKGPEAAFLAALHAIRGAGRKLPVNLVLVAEGEEEIGSPHFPQIVRRPEVLAALRSSIGVVMPSAAQELDRQVIMTLRAKGVIAVDLVSSGERWGRGPQRDIHSSNKARVDSPAWHLVEALATLVSPDGNDPAIDGFAAKARPLSPAEKAMIAEAANRLDEQ